MQPTEIHADSRVIRRYRLASGLSLVALILASTGCANVKPWQRGVLADRVMRADRDPAGLALTEHVYFSREAASGGRGVGGGGCGCN
jgi:hypothetical protein